MGSGGRAGGTGAGPRRRDLLVGTAAVAALVGSGASEAPVRLVLGTATPGGGFEAYGEALAAVVNAADPALEIVTRPTGGSQENVRLLETGALDLGLVQGEAAYEALAGIGRPPSDLTVIAATYATPGLFVVRADSPARSFGDLRGRRVAFGTRSSGLVILARYVLDALGLDPDRDFEAVYLERAGEGRDMIRDGRADALWGGGAGWPGFTAVAAAPGGARFIAPSEEEILRVVAQYPHLQRMVIPAGSYPGQASALVSVGSWTLLMARPGLPETTGYRLTRALDRSTDALARLVPAGRETTAANTAASTSPDVFHPGTTRYLQEIGLLRRRASLPPLR